MAGITSVQGKQCVTRFLKQARWEQDVYLIAIGKAAISMTQGACGVLGDKLCSGLVITKSPVDRIHHPRLRVLQSGHPVPDERSLQAGDELLAFIASLPPHSSVLFLLSGGASALVEVLPRTVDASQLAAINHWLLGSGLAIADMNAVRKRLSCVKGGRLALEFVGHTVTCLAISDVQGDDPGVIGSGLLVADSALQQPLSFSVPPMIEQTMQDVPPAPAASDDCFTNIQYHIIATLSQAKQAAALKAQQLGLTVTLHDTFVCGDALAQGETLARELLAAAPGVHIWGGETTVRLPPSPGRGGRNQSLALSAALILRGHDDVALLAGGTDGNDGPGEDAGAIVDGGSVSRGEKLLMRRAQDCLAQADAGRLLDASGDLLQTGPTGTNVMDLIIGIKLGPPHAPQDGTQ